MWVPKLFSVVITTCIFVSKIAAEQNFKIGLRTLIISTDLNLDHLPTEKLEAVGAHWDLMRLVDDNGNLKKDIKFDNMYDGDHKDTATKLRHPKYGSFVFLSARLEYYDKENKNYPSALNEEQWEILNDYRRRYGVRTVILQSNSNVDDALKPKNEGTDAYADLKFTDYVKEFNSNIRPDATFKLGQEYRAQSDLVQFYWFPCLLDTDANADGHVKPFMEIKEQNDKDEPASWAIGAFTLTKPGGEYVIEEMHFLFTANSGSHHGLALADIWIPWVTKGAWMGQRRILLNTQIDDYLIATNLYESNEVYRNTATDLELLSKYQYELRKRMPAGSNFTIELAFNAQGYGAFNQPQHDPNVDPATIKLRDEFLWLSHTWSHMDLYCTLSNCDEPNAATPLTCYNWTDAPCDYGKNDEGFNEPKYPVSGFTPYEFIVLEVTRNQYFAKHLLFEGKDLNKVKNWSPHAIVTPRISGLNYTVSIKAMLEAGIFSAVGDNSRADLAPDNIFHGFNAKPLVTTGGKPYTGKPELINGKEGLFVIPRFATRIYYDVATPEQNAAEHNTFYGPNCEGHDQEGVISFMGLKCNKTSYKYDHDLTFDELLEVEAYETARNLLHYRTDPYMFHQANLKFYDGKHCLLSRWIDATVKEVMDYNTFPFISYRQDDLTAFYHRRMERDRCNAHAYIEYQQGKPALLDIRTSKLLWCDAAVTITQTQGADNKEIIKYGKYGDKADEGSFHYSEGYGVDTTYLFHVREADRIRDRLDQGDDGVSGYNTNPVNKDVKPNENEDDQVQTNDNSSRTLIIMPLIVIIGQLGLFII